jgi:hypothetical protein
MASAVVPDSRRDGARLSHQLFDRLRFVRSACDGLVQVVDIGLVVLPVVDLHREGVDMGFERFVRIGEGCECEWHVLWV